MIIFIIITLFLSYYYYFWSLLLCCFSYGPTIANKWKDDKIKYKKRGRHKSKRYGKGPGE